MNVVPVVVAATFTADSVADPLKQALSLAGVQVGISFAGYQQVLAELTQPGSGMERNRGGINVLLLRPEDLVRYYEGAGREQQQCSAMSEIAGALGAFADRNRSTLIVMMCPSTAGPSTWCWPEFVTSHPSVHLVSPAELVLESPDFTVFNADGEQQGHVPYSPEYFAQIAYALARKIHALRTTTPKVIVTDADETLWKGIAGEDGPGGVQLDEPRRVLQSLLRQKKDEGILLALCSKNAESDVAAVFAAHPDWPLQFGDFVAHRINWEPKPANLRSLATELGLGLDSFVFLDDSPTECARVRAETPEVITLELPRDVFTLPSFLGHVWPFDRRSLTAEDTDRTAAYQRERERTALRAESTTFADYLQNLQIELEISPLDAAAIPRAAQLALRTNQFNTTNRRYSEADIAHLAGRTDYRIETVIVRDRFGDYGMVGLLVLRLGDPVAELESFLLSCRALGRGIEHEMLRHVLQTAKALGASVVDVPVEPTNRNEPARLFLAGVASKGSGDAYRLGVRDLIETAVTPTTTTARDPGEQTNLSAERPDWSTLARLFSHPVSRCRALRRQEWRARPELARSYVAPSTATEVTLARVWQDILQVENVGIDDNFFDLGGKSIHFVELHRRLVRLNERELTITDLFQFPTIASLSTFLAKKARSRYVVEAARARAHRQRHSFSTLRRSTAWEKK